MSTWNAPSAWTSIMTSALDNLANTASAQSTGVIANGTSKDIFIDISVRLSSIAPGTGPCMEIHLLPLLDNGTTYQDIVRADDVVPLTPATSAKSIASLGLRISPGSYQLAIVNQAGVSFGTGNTVYYRTYSPS